MRLALVLPMMLLVGGCATGEKGQAPAGIRDVDEAKMQAVEEAAARNGIRVYWVNPPRKPASQTGG